MNLFPQKRRHTERERRDRDLPAAGSFSRCPSAGLGRTKARIRVLEPSPATLDISQKAEKQLSKTFCLPKETESEAELELEPRPSRMRCRDPSGVLTAVLNACSHRVLFFFFFLMLALLKLC